MDLFETIITFLNNNPEWIITIAISVITSLITLAGIIFSYFSLKRNFKNEVYKMQQGIAINKLQEIVNSLSEIINFFVKVLDDDDDIYLKEMDIYIAKIDEIADTLYHFGNKDALNICVYFGKKRDELIDRYTKEKEGHILLAALLLLSVQVKYDITGDAVKADTYIIILHLTKYDNELEEMNKELINQACKDLRLNKQFML